MNIDVDRGKNVSLFDPVMPMKLNTSNDETRRLNENIRITAPEKKNSTTTPWKNVGNRENMESKKGDILNFFDIVMKNHTDKIHNSLDILEHMYTNNDRNIDMLNERLIKVQNRLEKLRKHQRTKIKRKEKEKNQIEEKEE